MLFGIFHIGSSASGKKEKRRRRRSGERRDINLILCVRVIQMPTP